MDSTSHGGGSDRSGPGCVLLARMRSAIRHRGGLSEGDVCTKHCPDCAETMPRCPAVCRRVVRIFQFIGGGGWQWWPRPLEPHRVTQKSCLQ